MRTETYFRTCNHCHGIGHCRCDKCKEIRGGEAYHGPCHACGGSGGSVEPLLRESTHPHQDYNPFQDPGSYDSRF